jgi:hypothetical protein
MAKHERLVRNMKNGKSANGKNKLKKIQKIGNERRAKFYTLFRRKTPLINTEFIYFILFYNPVPGWQNIHNRQS